MPTETTITLLCTNDIHGRFLGGDGAVNFARLAAYKKQLSPCLLIDAGDPTQGTPFAILEKGLLPLQLMAQIGYDAVTIGNHEFDNITKDPGVENELDRNIKDALKEQFTCCNVYRSIADKPVNYIASLQIPQNNGQYLLRTIGGKTLLLIGVTKDIATTIPRMAGFTIAGLEETAQHIDALIADVKKAQSIDCTILITHLGHHLGQQPILSSTELARRINGVDLILDGHSHELYLDEVVNTHSGKKVPILQANCNATHFGQITLTFGGGQLQITAALHPAGDLLTLTDAEDAPIKALLAQYQSQVDQVFAREVTPFLHTTLWGGALDESRPFRLTAVNIARYAATNMGHLTAQAMIAYCRRHYDAPALEPSYIIGAINGGAVRDCIGWGGPITSNAVFQVLPSPLNSQNESGFAVFALTIAQLKAILQHSLQALHFSGGWLLAREGLYLNTCGIRFTLVYHPEASPAISLGSQAVLTHRMDGRAEQKLIDFTHDQELQILLCVPKYLASGGDGYVFAPQTPCYTTDKPLFQIVGDYMTAHSSREGFAYPAVENDVTYEHFPFTPPQTLTVHFENPLPASPCYLLYQFADGSPAPAVHLAVIHNQQITLTQPAGACVLQLLLLRSETVADNLYGEAFLNSYYHANDSTITMKLANPGSLTNALTDLLCFTLKINDRTCTANYIACTSAATLSPVLYFVLQGQIYQFDPNTQIVQAVSAITHYSFDAIQTVVTFRRPICYENWDNDACQATVSPALSLSPLYGYADGKRFDYAKATLQRSLKISRCQLYHDERLYGIAIDYTNGDHCWYGSAAGECSTVTLDDDDCLIRIHGCTDPAAPYALTHVFFTTQKLKVYGPFGYQVTTHTFDISQHDASSNTDDEIIALFGGVYTPACPPAPLICALGGYFRQTP